MQQMQLNAIKIQFPGNALDFVFRPDSVGDVGVINQIFRSQDYAVIQWQQGRALFNYYQHCGRRGLIIDAGANIGASAVYFLNTFSNAFVYAIEPEEQNFSLLCRNTESFSNKFNFRGAISNQDGSVFLETQDKSDWAFRTMPNGTAGSEALASVKSICVDSILADPVTSDTTPLILKIDIEGAEQELFDGEVAWMDRFPLIIIELHDWMLPFSGSSRNFLKAAAMYDFDFLHRGENIFLFNRRLLSS